MPRLNVEFNPRQAEALQRLAGELDESQVGVIRKAIGLMVLAVEERKAGNRLGVVRGDKVVKEIAVMWEPVELPAGTAA